MRIKIEADDTPAYHLAPELSIYRNTTIAVLRKYFRMSLELGHLPSLLGREFFRSHVTSYSTHTFEDAVIFTHDVERCLESLPKKLQTILARMVWQEYTFEETAALMDVSIRSVIRWHGEALDRLAEVFVRHGLLEPIKLAQASDAPPSHEEETVLENTALPPKKPVQSIRAASATALELAKVNCL